jgi:hypothetical protein
MQTANLKRYIKTEALPWEWNFITEIPEWEQFVISWIYASDTASTIKIRVNELEVYAFSHALRHMAKWFVFLPWDYIEVQQTDQKNISDICLCGELFASP